MSDKQVPGRIGKITYKAKNISVFPQRLCHTEKKQLMLEQLVEMFDEAPDDLAGYVVMGWNAKGGEEFVQFDTGDIHWDNFSEVVRNKLIRHINEYLANTLEYVNTEEEDDNSNDED